jgi:hypothetical protein
MLHPEQILTGSLPLFPPSEIILYEYLKNKYCLPNVERRKEKHRDIVKCDIPFRRKYAEGRILAANHNILSML